ncbi:crossover junction endodeoxyribonuclease RuvC [Paenibacillus campinasensis]|uniref:Holliday junction nuclease RuvC n=1 Tax=Paenibacillus campinasensis TaxID=66347 RepID=A0A268EH19_9BACL|nr:crossover junction endodeoxyribonuclease RuvC [Paenibacillus campinasensis]PAD72416.1 hypothetical protein CHH67_22510 [Paenibacillus campinasensis]
MAKTTRSKEPPQLHAGLDLSLTSPGFAVIEVRNRQAHLIATSNVKTVADEAQPLRYEVIEAHALLFFRKHSGLTTIVREIWPPSRNFAQNDKVHGAWSAVDRALSRLGLEVTVNLAPPTVKKTLCGSGSADKKEVAAAVRRICRLPDDYKFATDDESDAAAIVLAHLIRENLIDGGNVNG